MDHSIRVIKRAGKSLSLSFDDGPDAEGTPAVLDILARYDVRATFFVVANRARLRTGLLKQILAAGHSIGNHSLDHSWRPFFGARETLLTWIKTSEQILSDLSGKATVGFRSPAGVQTPPLHWALAQLGMPLIHWNIRFYDAVWSWRLKPALASLARTTDGSIVLLHDLQRAKHLPTFLQTLARYIETAKTQGFALEAITANEVSRPFE